MFKKLVIICESKNKEYMQISVVIVSYNTSNLTLKCIESIKKHFLAHTKEIIVVDNHSFDDTCKMIKKQHKDVKLIENKENLGFSKSVNIGVRVASADFIAVLNSDTEFFDDSYSELFKIADSKLGIACPQYLFPDMSWQRSFGDVPSVSSAFKDLFGITWLKEFMSKKNFSIDSAKKKSPRNVPYCDGAGFLVNKRNFETIGGFDEKFFFYSEEADFAVRARKANLNVLFVPNAFLMHIRGGSVSYEKLEQTAKKLTYSKLQFLRKHSSVLSAKLFLFIEFLYYIELSLINKFFRKQNLLESIVYAREYLSLLKGK